MSGSRPLSPLLRVGLTQALGYAATLGWNLLLARSTDLELYGKISFSIAIILILQVIFALGSSRGLIRFLPGLVAEGKTDVEIRLRRSAATRSLIFGLSAVALAMVLERGLPDAEIAGFGISLWVPILGAGLGAALVYILTGWFIGRRLPAAAAFVGVTLLSCLLFLAFFVSLRTGYASLENLLWVILMVFGGAGLVSALVLWGRPSSTGKDPDSRPAEFKAFATKSLAIGLVALGLSYLDRVMLGAFGQFTELGIYNIPARLARILYILIYLMNPIMGPLYARNLESGARKVALDAYHRSSRLIAAFTLPLALAFLFFGRDILAFAAGSAYAEGAGALALLTAGAFIVSFAGNNSLLLQMGGRESSELRMSLLALGLNFLLNLLLIPRMGALGAALATVLSLLITVAGRSWIAWRHWRVLPGGFSEPKLLSGLAAFSLIFLAMKSWTTLPWPVELGLCLAAFFLMFGWGGLADMFRAFARALGREGREGDPLPARLALIIAPAFALRGCYHGQDAFLMNAGYSITGISPPGDAEHRLVRERGMKTHSVPMARDASFFRDVFSLCRLWFYLLFHRFDVIQVSTPKASLLGLLACRLSGQSRVVYLVRGRAYQNFTGPRRRFYDGIEWLSCRLAARVVPVSRGLGEDLVGEGLCSPSKICMAGSGSSAGVDLDAFAPHPAKNAEAMKLREKLGIHPGETAVLFVGWLRRDKGLNELLRAFLKAAERTGALHLLLLGEFYEGDPLDSDVKAAIREDPRIHKLAWTEDVAPLYAAADMLALPSWREGFPRVALEASASGLAVISTDIQGCRESVIHGETGLLVPWQDAAALAEAMQKLAEDPALRRRLGRAGRQRAEREFAREDIWREHLRIMDELLGEEYGRGEKV